MKLRVLGILLLWHIGLQANEMFNFQTFNIKAGLTDNYIVDIAQDQYGFMWFASPNGLNRYDGYQVKPYSILGLGPHNNSVSRIAEDKKGTLWIMTPTDFYYYYNRKLDKIDNKINDKLSELGIHGPVRKMFIDEDANLWCLTNDTLFYYDYTKEQLFPFYFPPGDRISSLTCRQGQAYILYSNHRLGKVDFQ